MKKVAYYHIYLTDDYGTWASILMEQFKCMEDSGLLKAINEMRVTLVTKHEARINPAMGLICSYVPSAEFNLRIHPYAHDDEMIRSWGSEGSLKYSENWTLQDVWNHSQKEEAMYLYFHSKGVTAPLQLLRNNGDWMKYKSYHYWRAFLNWGVLEKWEDATRMLGAPYKYDVSGVNYFSYPCPHYSGNFWWSTSEYVKTLPDPSTKLWWEELKSKAQDQWLRTAPDRFSDEMWILSKPGVKAYSAKSLDKPMNFNTEYLPRSAYA